MNFKKLLENPEKYRCGENYKATNIVFPVEFLGEKYVVKQAGFISSLANFYYSLQERLFYRAKEAGNFAKPFLGEASCLETLAGYAAPEIFAYDEKTMVREYIEGASLQEVPNDKKEAALELAFRSLRVIHHKGVIVGDANVKNMLLRRYKICPTAYWIDFEKGDFEKSNSLGPRHSSLMAADALKFVYSTYTQTNDEELTIHAAKIVARQQSLRQEVRKLIKPDLSALRLWFPTRIPVDGKLNRKIKEILRG